MFNKKYSFLIVLLILCGSLLLGACAPAPAPEPMSAEEIAAEAEIAAIKAAMPTELSDCITGMVIVRSSEKNYEERCIVATGDDWQLIFSIHDFGPPVSYLLLFDGDGNFLANADSSYGSSESYYNIESFGLQEASLIIEAAPTDPYWDHVMINKIEISEGYQPTNIECITKGVPESIQANWSDISRFGNLLRVQNTADSTYNYISLVNDGENAWLAVFIGENELILDESQPLPSYGETISFKGSYINDDTGENISLVVPVEGCGADFYATDIIHTKH